MLHTQRWTNISGGEHDPHTGNITCAGHRRYNGRSIDTDYRSYCITLTVFISTYIIWFIRALPAKNEVHYVWHCRFYHHRLFINIRLYLVNSLALTEASYQISTDPR